LANKNNIKDPIIFRKMKKRLIVILVVILVGLALVLLPKNSSQDISVGKPITGKAYHYTKPVQITYENLPAFLSKNNIINDLPEDVTILLRFYNFNSGEREYERTFIITRGNVKEGNLDDPDLYLDIHSKYLNEWNSANFCNIMTKANNNGDLGFTSKLSTTKLLWKFKSLTKYKSCFGL